MLRHLLNFRLVLMIDFKHLLIREVGNL